MADLEGDLSPDAEGPRGAPPGALRAPAGLINHDLELHKSEVHRFRILLEFLQEFLLDVLNRLGGGLWGPQGASGPLGDIARAQACLRGLVVFPLGLPELLQYIPDLTVRTDIVESHNGGFVEEITLVRFLRDPQRTQNFLRVDLY